MSVVVSLVAVLVLALLVWLGVGVVHLDFLFAVIIPYSAIAIFIVGFIYRILTWTKSPVPFKITTTCGQQKSLRWIKHSELESPSTTWGVIGRMALEVLLFRSLFRNTRAEFTKDQTLAYGGNKWLWLFALAFHWSFLVVFIRHFRFFAEPVPGWIAILQSLDGFFQVGVPEILFTGVILLGAVTYLFLRRIFDAQIRYISLPADYFPLLLIIGIAGTGIWMRYFSKVDLIAIKDLAMGLVNFQPIVADGLSVFFYVHLVFVCVLFAYFPFSKLMHLGGVFLSPTRNMANNNRAVRHINPWNQKVKVHTYEEWEDEFREVMKEAGMPLEKE